MKTRFVEAGNGFNWGKFMVAEFTADEWAVRSAESNANQRLIAGRGWGSEHRMVFDLQTGEGALFAVHRKGVARSDLNKHHIWVCPLFEPFLAWLYEHFTDLDSLPAYVKLPEAESALYGYRRGEQDSGDS